MKSFFFHRIHRIERKSYTFYSNSPQILHLLAIFSGDTSTRGVFSWVFEGVILFSMFFNRTLAAIHNLKRSKNAKGPQRCHQQFCLIVSAGWLAFECFCCKIEVWLVRIVFIPEEFWSHTFLLFFAIEKVLRTVAWKASAPLRNSILLSRNCG